MGSFFPDYTKTTWVNNTTPLSAANLQNIEDALEAITEFFDDGQGGDRLDPMWATDEFLTHPNFTASSTTFQIAATHAGPAVPTNWTGYKIEFGFAMLLEKLTGADSDSINLRLRTDAVDGTAGPLDFGGDYGITTYPDIFQGLAAGTKLPINLAVHWLGGASRATEPNPTQTLSYTVTAGSFALTKLSSYVRIASYLSEPEAQP